MSLFFFFQEPPATHFEWRKIKAVKRLAAPPPRLLSSLTVFSKALSDGGDSLDWYREGWRKVPIFLEGAVKLVRVKPASVKVFFYFSKECAAESRSALCDVGQDHSWSSRSPTIPTWSVYVSNSKSTIFIYRLFVANMLGTEGRNRNNAPAIQEFREQLGRIKIGPILFDMGDSL